jgi:mRNA interferase YafQ
LERLQHKIGHLLSLRYKSAGVIGQELEGMLSLAVTLLAEDRRPCAGGRLGDHRECHLKPDLLLIYRTPDGEVLQLVRLGSHSELFG